MSVTQLHPEFHEGDLVEVTKGELIDLRARIAQYRDGDYRLGDGEGRVFGWVPASCLRLVESGPVAQQDPLIEVPLEDLCRQWGEQYDAWADADSEAKEARSIAKEERKKLDAIALTVRNRLKGGGAAQLALAPTVTQVEADRIAASVDDDTNATQFD